jgi:hypothetical protein
MPFSHTMSALEALNDISLNTVELDFVELPNLLFFTSNCWLEILVFITGARGTELPPPFLTFCLHIYFQKQFLYFFIISSLFPYLNLFVSIFIQSYMITATYMLRPYIIIVDNYYIYIGSKHVSCCTMLT